VSNIDSGWANLYVVVKQKKRCHSEERSPLQEGVATINLFSSASVWEIAKDWR